MTLFNFRLGFWNLDSLTASYLNRVLPTNCLVGLAGFRPDSTYFIERDCLEPPQELQDMIFPWLPLLEQELLETLPSVKTEYSGIGFIQALKLMRKVVLQDAVLYLDMPDFRYLEVFKLPVFLTEEFKTYGIALKSGVLEARIPQQELVKRVWFFIVGRNPFLPYDILYLLL